MQESVSETCSINCPAALELVCNLLSMKQFYVFFFPTEHRAFGYLACASYIGLFTYNKASGCQLLFATRRTAALTVCMRD